MKTIKKMLLLIVMLTIVTGYANENVILEFSDVKKVYLLTIKDSEGIIIHEDSVERHASYLTKFDFSELKDGFYTIELNKDFEILIKPFRVKLNEVIFFNDEETKEFKPVVRTKENQLIVSQLALNRQPLEVELYYNEELIHREVLKDEYILQRTYRLSKSEKGNYALKMVSGDRLFVKNFNF